MKGKHIKHFWGWIFTRFFSSCRTKGLSQGGEGQDGLCVGEVGDEDWVCAAGGGIAVPSCAYLSNYLRETNRAWHNLASIWKSGLIHAVHNVSNPIKSQTVNTSLQLKGQIYKWFFEMLISRICYGGFSSWCKWTIWAGARRSSLCTGWIYSNCIMHSLYPIYIRIQWRWRNINWYLLCSFN